MDIDETVHDLLSRLSAGDRTAQDILFEALYGELHALAHLVRRKKASGESMRTTELVHATYLKLCAAGTVQLNDANHFYSLAARMMRQVLTDEAARLITAKRGGGATHVTLETARIDDRNHERALEMIALDEGLRRLADKHPHLAHVIELRFFLESTVEEAAVIMKCANRTITRYDADARKLLREIMDGGAGEEVVPRGRREGE
jgi:RNA polymerase sigma factor (TIGR02999 family)